MQSEHKSSASSREYPSLRSLMTGETIHEAAPSLLAAQVWPSCGYALSATSPEPDGCSVCPECGAAWKRTEPAN